VHIACGKTIVSDVKTVIDHRILVTNRIEDALAAIRAIDSSRFFVDNEKSSDRNTVAMSLVSATSNFGILYYGRDVHVHEHKIYELLTSLDTICYCWDRNLERNYPNLIDLQRLAYETGLSGDREKLSLRDYAIRMAITHKRSIQDYNVYASDVLPDQAIEYAVLDATILKEGLRQKAEKMGETRVVTVGMADYRIPKNVYTSVLSDDETYCNRFQTMTFARLE